MDKKWKMLRLILVATLAGAIAGEAQVVPEAGDGEGGILKVTLLGTGGPAPRIGHFGPSTLVEAGTRKFLFDCGRGATLRLTEVLGENAWYEVASVFLTHLHSDHVVGIPDLWLSGWLWRREAPLRVWGPEGTEGMMEGLEQAYAFDIKIRRDGSEQVPGQGVRVVAKDIGEGVAYEEDGLKVTAFFVNHGSIKPALGYRLDYAGRSVVVSGDTSFSENLIGFSEGVDLMIHEVMPMELWRPIKTPPGLIEYFHELHSTPEQAGKVFSQVKPKLAVYSHCAHPPVPDADLVEALITATRKTYSGPLRVGEDLMTIEVGEKVRVLGEH